MKALNERLVPVHASFRREVANWLQGIADQEECSVQQVVRKIVSRAHAEAKGTSKANGAHTHDKAPARA